MPGTSWSPRPVLKVLGGLLHQWRLEAHLGGARRTRKVCSCGEGQPSAGLMFEDAQEVSLEAMGPLEGSYACVTALRPLPAAREPPSGFWLLTPETAWRAPHKQRSAYSDHGTKRPPAEKGRAQRCTFRRSGVTSALVPRQPRTLCDAPRKRALPLEGRFDHFTWLNSSELPVRGLQASGGATH
jgi:hypothetical protein